MGIRLNGWNRRVQRQPADGRGDVGRRRLPSPPAEAACRRRHPRPTADAGAACRGRLPTPVPPADADADAEAACRGRLPTRLLRSEF